jgi:hypothetical protein
MCIIQYVVDFLRHTVGHSEVAGVSPLFLLTNCWCTASWLMYVLTLRGGFMFYDYIKESIRRDCVFSVVLISL